MQHQFQQGQIQPIQYNQNVSVVDNEPKQIIFYYSRRCNDCSIFSKTLNNFLSLNKDAEGRSIYQVQSICIDTMNNLPRVLKRVPAVIYNREIIQGHNAFIWINDFTYSKSFVPVGTEKNHIESTFLDGSDNNTDSSSTNVKYTQGENPNVGQNFNEEAYMKNLMDSRGIQQAQPESSQQRELPDALKPQVIDKKSGKNQVNSFYQQLVDNRATNQPRAPSTKFDSTPQRQPHVPSMGLGQRI